MKSIYTITEVLLSAGLIYFGEVVGTSNMWYVIAAIITAYLIMDFLYKIRRYCEKRRKTDSRRKEPENGKYTTQIPLSDKGLRAEENAKIKIRYFYNDAANM